MTILTTPDATVDVVVSTQGTKLGGIVDTATVAVTYTAADVGKRVSNPAHEPGSTALSYHLALSLEDERPGVDYGNVTFTLSDSFRRISGTDTIRGCSRIWGRDQLEGFFEAVRQLEAKYRERVAAIT